MRRPLSERIRRALGAKSAISKEELARWETMAASMELRIEAARALLEQFEPDEGDTYGAMMRSSVIDALDGDDES